MKQNDDVRDVLAAGHCTNPVNRPFFSTAFGEPDTYEAELKLAEAAKQVCRGCMRQTPGIGTVCFDNARAQNTTGVASGVWFDKGKMKDKLPRRPSPSKVWPDVTPSLDRITKPSRNRAMA
jgi:hypothetical protein